jgi:hypothetical protein
MKRDTVAVAIALLALGGIVAAQGQTQKRFTGGRVTLVDQGSFFIGGVTEVTDFATAPGGPGGAAAASAPQQITIGLSHL